MKEGSNLVIFSQRDFSRVLARLSGSGLAPSGGRIGNALGLLVWSSKHEEISESVEFEIEMPERKY